MPCSNACAEEQEAPESADGAGRTLERVRVKRVNAGKLTMQNVLAGWTSVNDWNGDVVLQPFDLFNGELDNADATDEELASRDVSAERESAGGDTV